MGLHRLLIGRDHLNMCECSIKLIRLADFVCPTKCCWGYRCVYKVTKAQSILNWSTKKCQLSELNVNHVSFFFLSCPFVCSGRKWVATMKTSTPLGPTRCVMSLNPAKTTGSSLHLLTAKEHSEFTWRYDSLCVTAAPSQMSLVPVKRHLICITMKRTLSSPPKAPPSGWRHHTWR